MRDNFQTDLADNHQPGLSDVAPGTTSTSFFSGGTGIVMAVFGFAVTAIPVTAGFLMLKDRWFKKGRKRSKK